MIKKIHSKNVFDFQKNKNRNQGCWSLKVNYLENYFVSGLQQKYNGEFKTTKFNTRMAKVKDTLSQKSVEHYPSAKIC